MANYISKIKLGGTSETQYQIKDSEAVHSSDFTQKGAILYGTDSGSFTQLIPVSNTGMVLGLSNGIPAWVNAASASGIGDGALKLQLNDETEVALFTANSTSNKTLRFATGTTDGTFDIYIGDTKVGSVPIFFQSGSAAKVTVSSLNSTAQGYANTALNSAKSYTDTKISGLGAILNFKGTKTSESDIKELTSAKVGDVWINTADNSEWVCTTTISAATPSAWEKLGPTINLSGYVLKGDLGTLAEKDNVNVTVKYDKANATSGSTTPSATATISSADLQSGETGNYTPKGTVSVNVSVNPSTASYTVLNGSPTLPSMNGSNSSWEFDVADEILTISGGNSNLTFNAGSIPIQNKTVVTGITSATGTGTFTGTATKLSASLSGLAHTHSISHTETAAKTTVSYS